jgi:hypothetical protein
MWVSTAMTPSASSQHLAQRWLFNYFTYFGHTAPNRDMTTVAIQFRFDVYAKYYEEFEKAGVDDGLVVPRQKLLELWRTCFPNVVERHSVNLDGKCETCYRIDEIMKTDNNKKVIDCAKRLHNIHRGGLFQLERGAYQERILEAMLQDPNDQKLLSIVIDGMDQSHCRCPYEGTQHSFSAPLIQHFTGVKEHCPGGSNIIIYRTINTLSGKSPNIIIHVILDRLEQFFLRHGRYPEKFYLQIDGGSENANRWVLGLLELLVAKRIVKTVLYSRLPVGHTHCDIDGIFGILWKHIFNEPCQTLSRYEEIIKTAFKLAGLEVEVKDLFVCPDYKQIIGPFVDPNLSNLHCTKNTKHQWRFDAVEVGPFFPLGVKVCYKAYSCNEIVEIELRHPRQCHSFVGSQTGLEPVMVYNTWEPEATGPNSIPGREGIEGFYLLSGLPNYPKNLYRDLPYMKLAPGTANEISRTMTAIRREYLYGTEARNKIRQEWEDFYRLKAPENDEINDYLVRLRENKIGRVGHVPLRGVLFSKNIWHKPQWTCSSSTQLLDPQFKWPDVLSAAMNSVRASFQGIWPMPRVYASTDHLLEARVDDYHNASGQFYDNLKK